jgi:AI-2 transport protein TqsA
VDGERRGVDDDGLACASVGGPKVNGADRRGLPPALQLLLGLAAAVIILLGMRIAAGVIVPLLLATVVTMAVLPLLEFLTRHRMPRWLAYLVTVIVIFAAIAFVVMLGFSGVARLIDEVPKYHEPYAARMQDLKTALGAAGGGVSATTQGQGILAPDRVSSVATDLLRHLEGTLKLASLTLGLVLFLLWEATTLSSKFSQTPPQVGPLLARLENFTRDTRSFVRGATLTGLATGAAVGLLLWLLHVDYPLLWATLAFFLSFIPTLGLILAMLPPALLALVSSGWTKALLVVLGFLLVHIVVEDLLGHRIIARRTNLSLAVVILSALVWGWVLGPLGALLAVPMTLLVRRLFIEAYDESGWVSTLLGGVRPAGKTAGTSEPVP